MSTLTQFTVTGKEKDEFYGFHITGIENQVIRKVITKKITGTSTNHSIYEYALSTPYDATSATFTTTTSLVRNNAENSTQSGKSDMPAYLGIMTEQNYMLLTNFTQELYNTLYHQRMI